MESRHNLLVKLDLMNRMYYKQSLLTSVPEKKSAEVLHLIRPSVTALTTSERYFSRDTVRMSVKRDSKEAEFKETRTLRMKAVFFFKLMSKGATIGNTSDTGVK